MAFDVSLAEEQEEVMDEVPQEQGSSEVVEEKDVHDVCYMMELMDMESNLASVASMTSIDEGETAPEVEKASTLAFASADMRNMDSEDGNEAAHVEKDDSYEVDIWHEEMVHHREILDHDQEREPSA